MVILVSFGAAYRVFSFEAPDRTKRNGKGENYVISSKTTESVTREFIVRLSGFSFNGKNLGTLYVNVDTWTCSSTVL